jgi:hypothetical protein
MTRARFYDPRRNSDREGCIQIAPTHVAVPKQCSLTKRRNKNVNLLPLWFPGERYIRF